MSENHGQTVGFFGNTLRSRMLDDARETQDYYLKNPCLPDDIVQEKVARLNRNWPYRHEEMLFSGRAHVFCDSEAYETYKIYRPDEDNFSNLSLDRLHVSSSGFEAINVSSFSHTELVYSLVHENRDGDEVLVYGDIADSLLLPVQLSGDELYTDAIHWLPKEVEEIDVAVLNANDESTAVMALRGLVFGNKHRNAIYHNRQEQADWYKNSLTSYTNQLIKFDKLIPYQIILENRYCVYGQDGQAKTEFSDMKRERAFIFPDRLFVDHHLKRVGQYAVWLDGRVLFDSDEQRRVNIPLSSIIALTSGRQIIDQYGLVDATDQTAGVV